MSELRNDQRQWLIYEEEPVSAAMEAVEVLALEITGGLLRSAPDIEMRAVANVMLKWADARRRALSSGSESQQAAIAYAMELFSYIDGVDERPDEALDQMHAAVYGFDQKLNAAGITGDGWYRTLARGEHGR